MQVLLSRPSKISDWRSHQIRFSYQYLFNDLQQAFYEKPRYNVFPDRSEGPFQIPGNLKVWEFDVKKLPCDSQSDTRGHQPSDMTIIATAIKQLTILVNLKQEMKRNMTRMRANEQNVWRRCGPGVGARRQKGSGTTGTKRGQLHPSTPNNRIVPEYPKSRLPIRKVSRFSFPGIPRRHTCTA